MKHYASPIVCAECGHCAMICPTMHGELYTPRKDVTSTFGPAYDEELDATRIGLQLQRIKAYMLRQGWRTLGEIEAATGDPEASISAQLRHLRKRRFGAYTVEKRRRGEPSAGLWEYRVEDLR